MSLDQTQGIIEAILFTMGEAVEISRIAGAIEHDEETTRKIIYRMMDDYKSDARGITIIELDGAFQMCSKKDTYEYLVKVAKQPRKYVLTDVMLETLSIIAYKQPITRGEIEKIRGVSCDHAVSKLVEYELVEEVGRLDVPGRPILFGTTEEFLRRFGVTKVEDLPILGEAEIENIKVEVEDEMQMKLEL